MCVVVEVRKENHRLQRPSSGEVHARHSDSGNSWPGWVLALPSPEPPLEPLDAEKERSLHGGRGSRSQAARRVCGWRPNLRPQQGGRATSFAYSQEHKGLCNFLLKVVGQSLGPALPKPRGVDVVFKLSLKKSELPIL